MDEQNNELFNTNPDTLVEMVDPNLKLIGKFELATMRVYQVEKEDSLYLLKGTNIEIEDNLEDLKIEIDALSRAKNFNTPGIANIIHDYGVKEGYYFILKEFFPGTDARSLKFKFKESPNREDFYHKMQSTYNFLHASGSAGFDDRTQNYIISPGLDDICFTDFSASMVFAFAEDVSKDKFELLKQRDNNKLYNKFHQDKK